ncbi:hypothetical protein AGMMS49982_20410 [Bacteroidia bacterium]|nr:hypothetical protein AGMMS49982_20410 [Bacteroidia bacterium]
MDNILQQIEKVVGEHKLLGYHDFTEDEYSLMVDSVYNLCDNFDKHSYKLIFATLIEIAKRWKQSNTATNDDENNGYWNYVFKTIFSSDIDQQLCQKYRDAISWLGKNSNIPVVIGGQRYYATLMMHSLVPKKSIYSFFDLCYNVFREDLDFGFTSDDEWLCETVAAQMKNVLGGGGYQEDKDVSIGSSVYSIKIGLRSFALHAELSKKFVQFIKETFYQINKLFNREPINENTRLERYIVEWWKNKTDNEKVSDSTTRKKRIATVSKQNIAAKYIRNEDEVLLCIPPIRLDDENGTMHLFVYVNGEQFCSEEMRTKRGELVVSTKEKEFDLNDLKSINVRIEITENETVIYDSKEALNREYILFEDEKEVLSQINRPTNYFVYSKDIDALKSVPDELTRYSTNLYNIYPRAGETLTGEIKQVLFVDKANVAKSSNTVCLLGNFPDIEWWLDDIHCFVYKDSVKLIVPDDTNLKALELKIDTKTYKLEHLNYERWENNAYMFGLLKLGLLKPNEPIELSLYSYEKEAIVLTETLIVLPNLEIKFNKSVFYGDTERKITVNNNEQTWSNQDNEIKCELSDGNLLVKIPYLKWRIADKEWRNEPINRKLWYKDFLDNGDLLEIDNPREDKEIKLFVKSGGQKDEISINQSGKFEIGRAIYANQAKEDIFVYLSNGNENFELFTTSTKEHFVDNPVSYINGKVYWNVEDTFVGDKDNEFFLIIKSKDNNLRTSVKNANQQINNLYEDICKVQVKIKEKNIFSNAYKLISERDLLIGSPEKLRFKNKRIRLLSANCFNKKIEWIPFIPKYFIDKLELVEEDELYYKGRLCVIDQNEEIKVLNTMLTKSNTYEQINPVRIELRDNCTLWLVGNWQGGNDFLGNLFCDKKRKEICNIEEQNEFYDEINLYKFKEEEYV